MIKKDAYELMFRWGDRETVDAPAVIVGGSVKWRYTGFDDDGSIVAHNITDATSIAVAGQEGFPLKDLLDQVHVDSLSLLQVQHDRINELEETVSTKNNILTQQTATLQTSMDALEQRDLAMNALIEAAEKVDAENKALHEEINALREKLGNIIVKDAGDAATAEAQAIEVKAVEK